MKIALVVGKWRASKNAIIYNELSAVANEKGFPFLTLACAIESEPSPDVHSFESWRVFCLMQTPVILCGYWL